MKSNEKASAEHEVNSQADGWVSWADDQKIPLDTETDEAWCVDCQQDVSVLLVDGKWRCALCGESGVKKPNA